MAETEICAKEGNRLKRRRFVLPPLPSGRAHHRAGAQHRAVSRSGAADHARPASSIAAAQQAVRDQRQVGILLQRDRRHSDDPTAIDMHRMGTVANIVRYITAPDGSNHLVCQGDNRYSRAHLWSFDGGLFVQVSELHCTGLNAGPKLASVTNSRGGSRFRFAISLRLWRKLRASGWCWTVTRTARA